VETIKVAELWISVIIVRVVVFIFENNNNISNSTEGLNYIYEE
jgi:hypothetical protein